LVSFSVNGLIKTFLPSGLMCILPPILKTLTFGG